MPISFARRLVRTVFETRGNRALRKAGKANAARLPNSPRIGLGRHTAVKLAPSLVRVRIGRPTAVAQSEKISKTNVKSHTAVETPRPRRHISAARRIVNE